MRRARVFLAGRAMWTRFRLALRLIAAARRVKFGPLPNKIGSLTLVTAFVHRYEKSIAGHDYLIEVRAVTEDRWRAYIVRIPGVPTALMPFYGRTPDEAARQLSDWLTRAHQRATNSAARV